MKILAIRGQNLASLAGTFEVALDDGPLADAGLFAIVGETGSGKTTLLDAMCAALFDKTPRLEGHSSFKVGHGGDVKQRLGTADVRALVRNGETAGWAEVDFEGRDRRRYRARWEVQRARRKLDGNWQDQRMKLVRLDDGHVLGGTRTETLAAIRQVLGLSYDEFCRSALLAQFQFARFLKASASERAELLERMTGTRVYGDVSKAAHDRARALADERQRLTSALGAIVVLDDDARAALGAAEAEARRGAERGRAEQVALATAAAWRSRAAVLAGEVERGAAAEQAARAQRAAAEGRARELAAVERAGPVRAPWQARAEAARRLVLSENAVLTAEARVRLAGEGERAATARVEAAAVRVRGTQEVAAAAAPLLARARVLDVQVTAAASRAGEAAAAATVARARAGDAAAAVIALKDQAVAASAEAASAEAWLAARPQRVTMARDPARWGALIERAVVAQAAQAAARRQLDELAPRVHAADAARAAAEDKVALTHAEHELAKATAAGAEERARAAPLALAERAFAAAETRARGVENLAQIARDAAAAAAVETDGAVAAAAARAEAAVAERLVAQVSARRELDGVALREAEDAVARLRVAAGHEAARAELHDGDECPVCGATEHPWRGGVVDAMVAAQVARVGELRQLVDGAARALRDHERTLQAASARGDELARAVAQAAARRGDLETAWREGLAAIGELPLVGAPTAPEAARWIEAAATDAVRARTQAAAARDAARALADEAVARQAAALAAAHALADAKDAARTCEQETMRLTRAADDTTRRRDEHGRVFDDARAELKGVLTATELRALVRDATSVRDLLAGELSTCAERLAVVERARAVLDQVRPAQAAAEAKAAELAQVRDERAAAAVFAAAALDQVRRERARLLTGRDADSVERELTVVRDAATKEEREAAAALSSAANAQSSATARRDDCLVARDEALQDHAAAVAAVVAALAATGLDEATAASHLARDTAWVTGTRAAIVALDAAVAEATAVAADRRRQSADHAALRPAAAAALVAAGLGPSLDSAAAATLGTSGAATLGTSGAPLAPSEAAAAESRGRAPALDLLATDDTTFADLLAAANARADGATARLATIELDRRTDEAARTHHARALAALAAHDAHALPYEQLAAVIGSADGKELRNFAQSLSLDALLAAANRHLDQLAPRYQLGRVPGLDLELHVIDREMGGDARAVNGLSGGESFLVSLALALGLSSMAAADVEVRTLFIDEGFGSLDPATLDAALGVLDTLRASGRQVGIVSHVADLEDRVAASISVRAVGGGRSVVQVRSARH